jgi:hypothetical protein
MCDEGVALNEDQFLCTLGMSDVSAAYTKAYIGLLGSRDMMGC